VHTPFTFSPKKLSGAGAVGYLSVEPAMSNKSQIGINKAPLSPRPSTGHASFVTFYSEYTSPKVSANKQGRASFLATIGRTKSFKDRMFILAD
jgi:hypothetical protein